MFRKEAKVTKWRRKYDATQASSVGVHAGFEAAEIRARDTRTETDSKFMKQ